MFVAGMTTLEHALPVPVLFDDVLTLFALSGTGYTPTHIVNYGGAWGEQYVWATEDVPNDPKYVLHLVCLDAPSEPWVPDYVRLPRMPT
jgi:hypothetical protein